MIYAIRSLLADMAADMRDACCLQLQQCSSVSIDVNYAATLLLSQSLPSGLQKAEIKSNELRLVEARSNAVTVMVVWRCLCRGHTSEGGGGSLSGSRSHTVSPNHPAMEFSSQTC